jgi:hypothetical protein
MVVPIFGLFQTRQDIQRAMGKREHRNAQILSEQVGRTAAADDNFNAVAHHLHGMGYGVVQSVGIDEYLIRLIGRQQLDPIDQRVAGCENADAYFFMLHESSPPG